MSLRTKHLRTALAAAVVLVGVHHTPVSAQVSVQDNVQDQGQSCFEVTTPTATYWYQKQGCGFSSIHDTQGNDWISYQPGGGAQGEYRGIPNMGWQFHPGYTKGGTTTLTHESGDRVSLRSEANGWICTWDFYATYARLTVLQHQEPYWFLYEGTPGGYMEPSEDYYYAPSSSQGDGVLRNSANSDLGVDLDPEWIAFGDPDVSRMFVLIHHTDDNLIDDYYDMGGTGGMTVFGFGRDNDKTDGCWSCMNQSTNEFTIAFIETTSETETKTFAEAMLAGDPVHAVAPEMIQPGGAPAALTPSRCIGHMVGLDGRLVQRGSRRPTPPGVYFVLPDNSSASGLLRHLDR